MTDRCFIAGFAAANRHILLALSVFSAFFVFAVLRRAGAGGNTLRRPGALSRLAPTVS